MLLVKSMSSGKPSPLNDDDNAADECKVHARGVDGSGRGKADKGRARGLVKRKKK